MNKETKMEKVETNHTLNNNKINYIKSLIENKLRGVTQTWGHNRHECRLFVILGLATCLRYLRKKT
jgi:hypothetical protein